MRRPRKSDPGDDGPNELKGTSGRDLICGFGGNDIIRGLGGRGRDPSRSWQDLVYAGPEDDVFSAGGDGRKDIVWGGRGRDTGSYDPQLDSVHEFEGDPDR